jgi:RpiB/LacA/LacB family sugar-phosphate isomerase
MEEQEMPKPRIIVGADHRGYELKAEIVPWLRNEGYEVEDVGTHSTESVDYPHYAFQVGEAVGAGRADRGILICHSGNGIAIAANKVCGVRAAVCLNPEHAEMARRHNDANVLVLGRDYIQAGSEREILRTWLESPFDGGRHARRVEQIQGYEREHARR